MSEVDLQKPLDGQLVLGLEWSWAISNGRHAISLHRQRRKKRYLSHGLNEQRVLPKAEKSIVPGARPPAERVPFLHGAGWAICSNASRTLGRGRP